MNVLAVEIPTAEPSSDRLGRHAENACGLGHRHPLWFVSLHEVRNGHAGGAVALSDVPAGAPRGVLAEDAPAGTPIVRSAAHRVDISEIASCAFRGKPARRRPRPQLPQLPRQPPALAREASPNCPNFPELSELRVTESAQTRGGMRASEDGNSAGSRGLPTALPRPKPAKRSRGGRREGEGRDLVRSPRCPPLPLWGLHGLGAWLHRSPL